MTAVALPGQPRRTWAQTSGLALTPARQLARAALIVVVVLCVSLLAELLVVSQLQQRAAQQRAFDSFRSHLAEGTAPIGPTDRFGRELVAGTAVAYLRIPSIGLRQVVGEGTTPGTLFEGPGHRRDTPLPGQIGTSMVLGRRASFGGSFRRLGELSKGTEILVTTAQGEFTYEVIGLRREGDRAPAPLEPGKGRLLLVTAAGRPFMPTGVLRVDAALVDDAVGGPGRLVSSSNLPGSEQIMGSDTSTLWALALWMQALVAVTLVAVWSWHRWGRAKTWVVFLPVLLLIGTSAAGEAARLMPNLL